MLAKILMRREMRRYLNSEAINNIEKWSEWLPVREIAAKIGMSDNTVYSVIRDRGLSSFNNAKKMRRHQAMREICEIEQSMREAVLEDL